MASYDSPGHIDPLPGLPGFQSHDSGMTAPGSASAGFGDTDAAGPGLESGTVGNSALVTPPGGSLVNADRVTVSPNDAVLSTQVQQYSASNPFAPTEDVGRTGAGLGQPRGAGNPNALNIDSLAQQVARLRGSR